MNSVEHKGVWSGMEWEKRAKTVNTNELNWRKRTTRRKADRWYVCLCIVWDAYQCLVMVESIGNFFALHLMTVRDEQLKKLFQGKMKKKQRWNKKKNNIESWAITVTSLDTRHPRPSRFIYNKHFSFSFSPECDFFFIVLIVCLFHLFLLSLYFDNFALLRSWQEVFDIFADIICTY